ncbi:MAG: 30S ribosomal protein S6 [Acidobacteria bacterium RIFCSPLOWO2_02_FULL_60_20]|nr:MAG: 30S ribosomal protein S6 [Acidobacteria bacterium RIFCSPLOWO2_02_FULL_60_20]
MRIYETIFILKPDLPDDEADKIVAQMEGVITSGGGTLRKTDRMGRRRLAYLIRRYREGQYVLLDAECNAATVQELERRLKVTEPVLKYQTVRVDEDLKRIAKLQAARTKNSARKKPRGSAAPAATSAAGPA